MKRILAVWLSISMLSSSAGVLPAAAQVLAAPKGGMAPLGSARGTAGLGSGSSRSTVGTPRALSLIRGALPGQTPAVQGVAAKQSQLPVLPGVSAPVLAPAVNAAPASLPAPLAAVLAGQDAPAAQNPEIDPSEADVPSRPSLVSRLAKAVVTKLSPSRIFDWSKPSARGLGIMPQKPINLPEGVELDPAPEAPSPERDPGVTVNSLGFPAERPTGSIIDESPITVLQADASNEAEIERAVRSYVDDNRSKYGLSSADLKTIHVKHVAGQAGAQGVNLAKTTYAYFHQQRNGITVHGSFASFTVKVIRGQAVLVATQARLYPALVAETVAQFNDEELKGRAEAKLLELGAPPAIAGRIEYHSQKIIYQRGAWRTTNLYLLDGLPFMIAVDVATGESFAWDSRLGMLKETGSGSGKISGRGEMSDSRPQGQPQLTSQALPHISVTLPGGKTAVTDKNGKFAVSASGAPIEFTATLSGKYAVVRDQDNHPLKVSATIKPGSETEVVFNPEGASELQVSQVNAYLSTTRMHDWLKERGVDDARIDKAIPVNVNIDDECNAYYTPGRPSLNFFKSSKGNDGCTDTARPGIIAHEYGHFVDDMIGGIVNGGLSEGWGDIFSMYMLGSPIIGDGFLRNRTPSYIRHGENDYQYGENDEVHDQGQAWMGFGWKLRKALVAAMGEAGAALAEKLVVPTLFAKAADIPTAIAQVLINDMDSEGNMPHESFIRQAALAHGINIPKAPIVGALALAARLSAEGLAAAVRVESAPGGATITAEQVTRRATVEAGLLVRGKLIRAMREAAWDLELDLQITDLGGGLSKTLGVEVSGPADRVERFFNWLNEAITDWNNA